MFIFIYNLLFPLVFLFFLPGLIYKLYKRGGWKGTFAERFGVFSKERKAELGKFQGAIWIHAVSVGETEVALSMIKRYEELYPNRKFILSTTTTTGQKIARDRHSENTAVIFCPIDFIFIVMKVLNVLKPSVFVIFETEIWPNLICVCRRREIPVAIVNARMSERSLRGYKLIKVFFAPLLKKINVILAQSPSDFERFVAISNQANIKCSGNMKFDKTMPEKFDDPQLERFFGPGNFKYLIAASTHYPEESLIADTYIELKRSVPDVRLILVPRHAERGNEVEKELRAKKLWVARRSFGTFPQSPVDVLLVDTTGELVKFMSFSDVVVMGKSLAGNNEGHNLLEPALLKKPIVTGGVLRSFRFILRVLKDADGVVTVDNDNELLPRLLELFNNRELCARLGENAYNTVVSNRGATDNTIKELENLLS